MNPAAGIHGKPHLFDWLRDVAVEVLTTEKSTSFMRGNSPARSLRSGEDQERILEYLAVLELSH